MIRFLGRVARRLGALGRRVPQPAGLIGVLSDRAAPHEDRADAAVDLAAYDDPAAEAALLAVARDPRESAELTEHCGEALADIWVRRGAVDAPRLRSLRPEARRMAVAIIRAERPDWSPTLDEPG